MRTDIGMVREHNEDSCYVDPAGTYFIVADGMGGHAAGEVASSMAVHEITRSLEAARSQIEAFAKEPADEGRQQLVQVLEDAVRRAHQAVYERGGRESDKRGMGTTLDVLLVADGEAFVAHVGDSRTYLLRGGAAAQVTTDHTVAEVLVIEGKLTPEEARLSPLRTILVNAIGVSADVGVELAHLKLRRGDKLLLCSDGLHDYFPIDSELAEVLGEKGTEDGLVKLVDMAKERGGHDNITGILVEVVEGATAEDIETVRMPAPRDSQAGDTKEILPPPSVVVAAPPDAPTGPLPKSESAPRPPTPVDAASLPEEDTTEEQPKTPPAKPAEVKAEPPKAEEAKPEEAKPEEAKPADAKPAEAAKPGDDDKPVETKPDIVTEELPKLDDTGAPAEKKPEPRT
jgi:serine/threonine protein phosphatase PrpC